MTLHSILDASESIPDLARRLGTRCLSEDPRIWELREDERGRRTTGLTEAEVACRLRRVTTPDLGKCLQAIRASVPVDTDHPRVICGVLRAMCPEVLEKWYSRTRPVIRLRYGDVYPSPRRSPRTDYPRTYSADKPECFEPLRATGYRIWRHPDNWPWIELDFDLFDELDQITYPPFPETEEDSAEGRLPVCASIHPYAGFADLDRDWRSTSSHGGFFGVGPVAVEVDRIADQLAAAARGGASVAVLPEMSLDRSDALSDVLRTRYAEFPQIVVAGSAHDLGTHTNTTITYLNGAPVLIHRKMRRFDWAQERRCEDIELGDSIRVLVARRTSLATIICSDGLHPPIVDRVVDAGVNLLLVPSLTPKMGPFETIAQRVATENRGVTVVCNGSPLAAGAPGQPFLVVGGAPREVHPVHSYSARGSAPRGRRRVLRFDPRSLTFRSIT